MALDTILVPLDGSTTSECVLPIVEEIAKRCESRVIFLRVENFAAPGASLDHLRAEDELRATLEPYRTRLQEAGIPQVELMTATGSEAVEILEAAEREGVDLIAMSTHGRSGPARWWFGSVAEQVLRSSPVPVLVRRLSPGG